MRSLRLSSCFLSEAALFCGALELNIRVLNLVLAGSELFEIARTFSSMSNIDVARAFGNNELFTPEQKEALWSIGCVLACALHNDARCVCADSCRGAFVQSRTNPRANVVIVMMLVCTWWRSQV
jgi:hypothetical protein